MATKRKDAPREATFCLRRPAVGSQGAAAPYSSLSQRTGCLLLGDVGRTSPRRVRLCAHCSLPVSVSRTQIAEICRATVPQVIAFFQIQKLLWLVWRARFNYPIAMTLLKIKLQRLIKFFALRTNYHVSPVTLWLPLMTECPRRNCPLISKWLFLNIFAKHLLYNVRV